MDQRPTYKFNSVPVCAVDGCENAGKRHTCPHDGTAHGHGRIHYSGQYPKHSLPFRDDGWHLMCNEHFETIVRERVEWERRELKIGDRAVVRNTYGGCAPIVEGNATLIAKCDDGNRDESECWTVQFDADDDGETYPRWINPRDKTFEPKS